MLSFEQAYDQFVKQKGDLFEKKEVPMDEEDRAVVERLHRFSNRITRPFFMTTGIISFGASVYLFLSNDNAIPDIPSWVPPGGIMLCSVALIAFSFYYKSYYSNLLTEGKKIVLSGIISKIKNSHQYYGVTISDRETIFFLKNQVEGYKAGDIVRCETLSMTEDIKKKIERIGNIRDWV